MLENIVGSIYKVNVILTWVGRKKGEKTTMRYVVKLSLAMLLLACLAVSAQAAQLFPLHTGQWMEQDKQDNLGNTWTVRVDVLEEVVSPFGGDKKYFHVLQQNYDGGGGVENNYIRSTETELFILRISRAEEVAFKLGPVGTNWIYEDGQTHKEIVAIEEVTIPYGGTYTAYKYGQGPIGDPNLQFEWVVPGLGWIVKEEDHWGANTLAFLGRAGMNPFFPFKTGMVMEYNSSDNGGHTWHMRLQVLEQATLSGKQYYHIRQLNYDPYHLHGGPDTLKDFYIRGDDKAVYMYDGVGGENIVFKAADKLTSWTYPENAGTVTAQIVDIVQVTVPYGGPLTAYKHQNTWTNGSVTSPQWTNYVVPGLTMVKIEDNDDNGRTFTHVLANLWMGGANPALILLLDQEQ
jgi:hypothetical protein